MARARTKGRDRSKFGEIDAYLAEIGEKDAMEILRAVMYGFSGQVCSKQKAVAFVGGSRKWLDKVCMRAPESGREYERVVRYVESILKDESK